MPQLKGKAAIDVICNPLGKSGGALIQQFMIISFGSLAASTPYLGGILLVIVLLWLNAARSLDKQFTGGPPMHSLASVVALGLKRWLATCEFFKLCAGGRCCSERLHCTLAQLSRPQATDVLSPNQCTCLCRLTV